MSYLAKITAVQNEWSILPNTERYCIQQGCKARQIADQYAHWQNFYRKEISRVLGRIRSTAAMLESKDNAITTLLEHSADGESASVAIYKNPNLQSEEKAVNFGEDANAESEIYYRLRQMALEIYPDTLGAETELPGSILNSQELSVLSQKIKYGILQWHRQNSGVAKSFESNWLLIAKPMQPKWVIIGAEVKPWRYAITREAVWKAGKLVQSAISMS